MDNPQFWSFQSQGSNRNLYILTEIASEESWWSDVLTAKRFISQLNSGEGDLTVWIDSPGGDCFAGASIYEALRSYSSSGRGKVFVNITGIAASAAGLIAMAGDEVRISIVGTFMLHDPWSSLSGNARKLRATADVLDEIREGQIRAYMRKSGKRYDEILALIQDDGTYMNARTAIENGFADGILGNDDQADIDWMKSVASVRVKSSIQRETKQIYDAINAPDALHRFAAAGGAGADPRCSTEEKNHKDQVRALMRACLECF